jgi:hypothetical protein
VKRAIQLQSIVLISWSSRIFEGRVGTTIHKLNHLSRTSLMKGEPGMIGAVTGRTRPQGERINQGFGTSYSPVRFTGTRCKILIEAPRRFTLLHARCTPGVRLTICMDGVAPRQHACNFQLGVCTMIKDFRGAAPQGLQLCHSFVSP